MEEPTIELHSSGATSPGFVIDLTLRRSLVIRVVPFCHRQESWSYVSYLRLGSCARTNWDSTGKIKSAKLTN